MSALQFSSTLTHLAETCGPPRYRCSLRRGFREQRARVKRRPAICLHNRLLINLIMKHRFPAKHSRGRSRMTSPSEKQLLAASWGIFCFCSFLGTNMIVVQTIRPLVLLMFFFPVHLYRSHWNAKFTGQFAIRLSHLFPNIPMLLLTECLWLNVHCHTF